VNESKNSQFGRHVIRERSGHALAASSTAGRTAGRTAGCTGRSVPAIGADAVVRRHVMVVIVMHPVAAVRGGAPIAQEYLVLERIVYIGITLSRQQPGPRVPNMDSRQGASQLFFKTALFICGSRYSKRQSIRNKSGVD
jgi:hypothetical protein